MLSESMEVFIREHEEEALELLRTIARIPAPSNHEEKRAEFCSRWLKEQGAEGVYIDEALNVVWPAVIREKNGLEVYMAHTDVVFPDEEQKAAAGSLQIKCKCIFQSQLITQDRSSGREMIVRSSSCYDY